jgi:hypothetical protein
MKYISFSLWGDKPIYNIGAIKNAQLWREIYPDWQMVVYYNDTVPKETIEILSKNSVKVIDMSENNIYGMFWRFFACDISDCEYAIFRDTDSRLSIREKMSVDEWIVSGKSIHIMRDHPAHGIPYGNNSLGILGGMWGIKSNVIPITDMINKFNLSQVHNYGNDQTFLKTVYSIFQNDRFTHDEFFEKKPFPIKRENGRFIGERIDEYDKPLTNDFKILL